MDYTKKFTRGAFWLTGQTFLGRAVTLATQVALANMLLPDDWGLFATTIVARALMDFIAEPGLRILIIQRYPRRSQYQESAFWLSAVAGTTAGALVCCLSPLVAYLYGEPELTGLLITLSLAGPLLSLQCIPEAKLRIDLKFGYLALLNFCQVFLIAGIQLSLAYFGYGAYSLVIPIPILAALRVLAAWYFSKAALPTRLEIRFWPPLINNCKSLAGNRILNVLEGTMDYTILGLLQPASVLGLYFFAFNLSIQPVNLFAASLRDTLFPTLTKLQNAQHQAAATVRTTKLLLFAFMPPSFLLALLSPYVTALLLNDHYSAITPMIQVLSIGMSFRISLAASASLVNAQGRYGSNLVFNFVSCVLFAICLIITASHGSGTTVAIGVALYFLIRSPAHMFFALSPDRSIDVFYVLSIYIKPSLLCALTYGCTAWICNAYIHKEIGDTTSILLNTAIFISVYGILSMVIAKQEIQEMIHALRHLKPSGHDKQEYFPR